MSVPEDFGGSGVSEGGALLLSLSQSGKAVPPGDDAATGKDIEEGHRRRLFHRQSSSGPINLGQAVTFVKYIIAV